MRASSVIGFCVLAWGMLYSTCSQATLGKGATDFGVKRTGVAPSVFAATKTNYRISESTLPSGTLVREYVSNDGIVFAVSWDGPLLPDLQGLLGVHFDTLLRETAKSGRAGRSQVQMVRPEVTVISGGHMRAFEGRAWVKSDFPTGFSINDIH